MDVSIIIVNYNTCKMTSECIDSVIQKTVDVSFEIILVDNASTDGSKEFFEKDSRVRYIYNDRNLGFGQANNIGINFAVGRNILFLNSDTLLVNNAVKIMSDYLDRNVSVGVVGGNLYTVNMDPIHSYRRWGPVFYELDILCMRKISKLVFHKDGEHNFTKRDIQVSFITGADLMIKKKVLDEVGAFDSRFFMYCEDLELCYRVRKAHYKVMSVPCAKIIHMEGASFSESKHIKRLSMNYSGLKLYGRIHHGEIYVGIIRLIWGAIVYSRIIYYSVINSPKREFWKMVKDI